MNEYLKLKCSEQFDIYQNKYDYSGFIIDK